MSKKICSSWPEERSLLVDVLSLAFGMGAWVSVTGFWVELPLLIDKLPEGWRVSSQLSIAQQLANIGPITWIIISCSRKGSNDDSDRSLSLKSRQYLTYFLLTIGIVANILFAYQWNAKVSISGSEHSIALIILMFTVGLIGCTSPVLLMPQMAIFPQGYLVSYLVGEGLGGFLPGIVSLIQGANEISSSEDKKSSPRFSPTIYFFFIAFLMLISLVSFYLLNNLKATKKNMIHSQRTLLNAEVSCNVEVDSKDPEKHISGGEITPSLIKNDSIALNSNSQSREREIPHLNKETFPVTQGPTKVFRSPIYLKTIHILLIQGWDCFFSSGFLPGITTFSSLPYGHQAFLLSSTIGAAIVPISCASAFLRKNPPRIAFIAIANVLDTMLAVYILVTASYSPNPPLVGTTEGEVLIVLIIVLYQGLSAYIKVNAAGTCRLLENSLYEEYGIKEGSGRGPLFWCGAVSQGSGAIGSVIAFILVTVLGVFKSK